MRKSILYTIPIDKIDEPDNIRQGYEEDPMKDLAKSVKSKGILQPLLFRRGKADRFNLIAGSRRLRAAKRNGLTSVPGTLVDEVDDKEVLILAATENLHRQDLNVFEKSSVIFELIHNHGMEVREVADALNKGEAFVRIHLKLLSLPDEVQSMIGKGEIPLDASEILTHAVADPAEQLRYACIARDNKFSAKELREFMKQEKLGGSDKSVRIKTSTYLSEKTNVEQMPVEKIIVRLNLLKKFVGNVAETLSSKKPEAINEIFLEIREVNRSIERDLKKIEEEHSYLLVLP